MVRLYSSEELLVGKKIRLPRSELNYFKKSHRGQGEILLFNSQSRVAFGSLEKDVFSIERVEINPSPIYHLDLALAFPESAVIPFVIRSLSELGLRHLFLFQAERSQSGRARAKAWSTERSEKLAREASRQCGRGKPLAISVIRSWTEVEGPYDVTWFFDEARGSQTPETLPFSKVGSALLIVGCEGGWSEQERVQGRERQVKMVHFPTPVLRVTTASICAAFFAIERLNASR